MIQEKQIIKGRFKEEQEIIDRALAARHATPLPVREYVSHFLRNDMMALLRQCKNSKEALDLIRHMSNVLRVMGM